MTTRMIFLRRDVILIILMVLNTVVSESNVAVSKSANQSSDYNNKWIAGKAVDNCLNTDVRYGCCIHTKDIGHDTVWWRVDLGELVTVNRIKIYYRGGYQRRFAGYQLFVSNTTNTTTDGVLCYEDESSKEADVQLKVTHQCPYVGQYVTVYNSRGNPKRPDWYSNNAILELCEVQVFDCIPQKYGTTCDQDCSRNCLGSMCEQVNGNCSDCIPQKYGVKCEHNCSTNCQGSLCEKDSGNCHECTPGLYGMDCTKTCGLCTSCIKDTGVCVTECDPGYQGDFCNTTRSQIFENTPVDAGPIVGAVVGMIFVAVIAIVIVILIRRRRINASKQESFTDIGRSNVHVNMYSEPLETENQPGKSDAAEKNTLSNTAGQDGTPVDSAHVYVNAQQVAGKSGSPNSVYYNSGPVGFPVSSLKSLVQTKLQNKAKAFENEYKSIPSGDLHEHKVGMLEQNKPKNRFKTTFPYDHSRVILDKVGKDPHSDYINANYIDSVTKPAEYVATQGPRPGTVNDFWRMIWQLTTGKIVMLTNLIEGGRAKCDKYWPDEGEPLITPHFSIILDRERSYAFYVIRDLTVTEKKTKSVRQIHQFHYTTWPDHGTPDPNELVVFHRRVMNYSTVLTGKMVVHCSAGIGRTGTFLALDALLEYGKECGSIDVMQYIKTMRKDRINMVQTVEQYIAIHQLLIEAFDMPDTLIPRMKYHKTLTALCNGGPTNQTKLRKEYQII
ncbi:receptor-type tyrosine-protein phosphatase T-like [Pecten maximus]|uniref:receptor-type tyrosine-protein phosphatase T-like n=1 Tax=Pecten maximus TaxID=6579 RepID=UPI001458E834|nr:receptor-type tyrosine-protein phosphatase T-like [Pecten maximus]